MGIVLSGYGKVSSPITVVASGFAVVITLIASGWGHVETFIVRLWGETHHSRVLVIGTSVVTVLILTAGVLLSPYAASSPLHHALPKRHTPSPVSSVVDSSPVSLPLVQPFCGDQAFVDWQFSPGTLTQCDSSGGLILQQTSPNHYAELSIMMKTLILSSKDHVGSTPEDFSGKSAHHLSDSDVVRNTINTYYELVLFCDEVDLSFKTPSDPNTWAGVSLLFHLSAGKTETVAFVINAAGQWQVQKRTNAGTMHSVGSGGRACIIPTQPTTLHLMLQDGTLYLYINDQLVGSYGMDEAASALPDAVGLIVERPGGTNSSPVLYSRAIISNNLHLTRNHNKVFAC